MDNKEAAEEFIRRESEPDFTKHALEFEDSRTTELEHHYSETASKSGYTETGNEFEFIETGEKPEFKEAEPQFNETRVEPEFTCTRTTTEFDAVHPRFRDPKKEEEVEEFQRTHDYYCEQCKLYFAPDVDGLNIHFKEEIVKHRPFDECFYCNGPVYAYTLNRVRQIYHNCEHGSSIYLPVAKHAIPRRLIRTIMFLK